MASIAAAYKALDDSRHRAEFYRVWRVGFSAAFTHPKTLETMGPRESAETEAARQWLLDGTRKGKSVIDLVKTGGARFDEFERALLTLGEESGRFEESLRLLGDFFTSKHALMLNVKKQLAYPMITGLAASFIAPLPLLVFGRPGAYLLSAFGMVALLLGAGGGIVLGFANSFGRKPAMARARMARALATAIEAGLSLSRALRLAADASANPEIRAHVRSFSENLLSKQTVVRTMAGCPHITPEFIGVIDVAERSGDFSAVTRLAEMYEDGFK